MNMLITYRDSTKYIFMFFYSWNKEKNVIDHPQHYFDSPHR